MNTLAEVVQILKINKNAATAEILQKGKYTGAFFFPLKYDCINRFLHVT